MSKEQQYRPEIVRPGEFARVVIWRKHRTIKVVKVQLKPPAARRGKGVTS